MTEPDFSWLVAGPAEYCHDQRCPCAPSYAFNPTPDPLGRQYIVVGVAP